MLRHHQYLVTGIVASSIVLSGCSTSPGAPAEDIDDDTEVDASGGLVCSDGLVPWPEHKVCAPRVDDCEPWEVPVVGGGCMAIGPRACPKLWDPDADVGCVPGELLDYEGAPCPEGFVLTDDEVACVPHFTDQCGELEIPVLGGGCERIGPEWAVPGQPLFDECGDGLLAIPGGGCAMIGPRGCPRTWNPDAESDCEVGDVLTCPNGWLESEDGMYCRPGWDECEDDGDIPLAGGGCEHLLAEVEDCPAGPFPDVPEGATDVLYVLADSPCTDGCGTEAAPYPSIQAAVDAAPDGATILVGPGTYDEGLTLDDPVHIVGLCPAVVELSGKGLVLTAGDSKVLEAGVGIFDVQGVTLSGLRVRSPAAGVAISGATDVTLGALEIVESHGVALYVDGGSTVLAEGLWIHDTEPGSGGLWQGRGAWVGGGANLIARSIVVEQARRVGIEVKGEGTLLDLTDGVIRDTDSDSSGKLGVGVFAWEGCATLMSRCLLEDNLAAGLLVLDPGTKVEISGSVIRKTMSDENGAFGVGVQASEGSTASISGCLLEENRDEGIAVANPGTVVEVSGSVIQKTVPDENGMGGSGIAAFDGGSVVVSGSLLQMNTGAGLMLFDPGAEVEVSGSVIRWTHLDASGKFGVGIQVKNGSTLSMSDSLLEENRYAGLMVADSDTKAEVSRCVVRGNLLDDYHGMSNGIWASLGTAVMLSDSLLEDNKGTGISMIDPGTITTVSGSVIRKTKPDENGELGWGLAASQGCTVSVSTSLLEESRQAGLVVDGSGTEVGDSESVVRGTLSSETGVGGGGISSNSGCTFSLSRSLLEENHAFGLLVYGSGTEATVSGSVIRGNTGELYGGSGEGIAVLEGGTVTVSGSLLEENESAGLDAKYSSTEARISASVIRKTVADENGEFGFGVSALAGSTVSVTDSLLEDNMTAGLAVGYPGTEVEFSGSVIRRTLPNVEEGGGYGIQVAEGDCTISVVGSQLVENREFGISGSDSGTEVEVHGSVIQGTLPNENGMNGMGLALQTGANGTASWCRIEGNSAAGVHVGGRSRGTPPNDPTWLHLEDSAILETIAGTQEFREGIQKTSGDGVVAFGGSEVRLDSMVVMGNERAGAYYHESAGAVSWTVIEGNGSYGLAMQDCGSSVDLSDNFIFGNLLEAVTENPHGLPLTPPPTPIVVGEAPDPDS